MTLDEYRRQRRLMLGQLRDARQCLRVLITHKGRQFVLESIESGQAALGELRKRVRS